MFGRTIRRRVMKAIEARIAQEQKEYEAEVKALEDKFEKDKVIALETHVEALISKIL